MPVTELDMVASLTGAAGGHAREAGADDAVLGMPARWVVSPADTSEVAAVLRLTHEHGLTVLPRGAGTKLTWGTPPQGLDVVLDLTRLDALVEHAAGDLIAIVGAGRLLTDLQSDLASAGQWLAVDPARPGTVGGLVATASTGPTRLLHGPVRDLVIGTTMVRADGVVAHSGGKVVKNVAGYDLGKLLTGSFGTLGVLTEVAIRLHPLPDSSAFVVTPVDTPAQAADLIQRLVHSHLVPTAVELDWAGAGAGADSASTGEIAVRLDGIGPGVQARTMQALELLGSGAEADPQAPSWWGTEPAGVTLLKVTHEIASVQAVLEAVGAASAAAGVVARVRGSAAVGTLLVGLGPQTSTQIVDLVARMRSASNRFGGAVVVLEAPADVRARLDVWGPATGLDLMRRVKQQFDPARSLAPGRFVGGI